MKTTGLPVAATIHDRGAASLSASQPSAELFPSQEAGIDRALLFLIVALVPLIPFSQFRLPIGPFLLPACAVPFALLAYWQIVSYRSAARHSHTARRAGLLCAFLGLWAMLSLTWSNRPQPSHVVSLLFYVTCTFVILSLGRTSARSLNRASTLLLAGVTVITLFGLFRLATGQTHWFEFTLHELTGLGTRNSDAFMVATVFPIAFARAIVAAGRLPVRIGAAVIGGLLVAAVLLSLSRSSTVGLAVVAFLTALAGRRIIPVRPRTLVVVLLLGGAALLLLNSYFAGRELSLARFGSVSESARIPLARDAFSIGVSHLITGIGYFNFPLSNLMGEDAHNAYLNLFAELGILGLLVFVLIVALPLARYGHLAKALAQSPMNPVERVLYLQGYGILATIVLLALTDTFYESIYFWLAYVFAVMHLMWLETTILPRSGRERRATRAIFPG